jgi:hypothetical protein
MLIIKIHNDGTGTNESANYTYGVFVNDRRIFRGRIIEHNRNHGWISLLCQLVVNALETSDKE